MPSSINNNLMVANVANTLNSHYGKLATSVQRLSSGLRINSAADDAAGLAIRELMRADVAALNQGVRNANDAISMLQVADGALGIIDEKLIRMKELAEQAATGTYNSTQRLMIHSEFVAMGEEIDRIARATDFNGIKLLDGSLTGAHDGSGLNSTGKLKVHFGSANDSAEDYYYVEIGDCTTGGLGLRDNLGNLSASQSWIKEAVIDLTTNKIILDIPYKVAGNNGSNLPGIDFYQLPVGLKNVTITSNQASRFPPHKPHVMLFHKDGTQLTGPAVPDSYYPTYWTPVATISGTRQFLTDAWWNGLKDNHVEAMGKDTGVFNDDAVITTDKTVYSEGASINYNGITGTIIKGLTELRSKPAICPEEIIVLDEITEDLVFFIGGHVNETQGCNHYELRIEAEITEQFIRAIGGVGNPPVLPAGDLIGIETQEKAQHALERLDDAIVVKDKVRAHLGTLQNRLENTVTNLTIQSENLQAAESRISDTDVATEMTTFVRNQVLTQSAVAMLGQANSYPHMLSGLITS